MNSLCLCGKPALLKGRCAECIEIALDLQEPRVMRRRLRKAQMRRIRTGGDQAIREAIYSCLHSLRAEKKGEANRSL